MSLTAALYDAIKSGDMEYISAIQSNQTNSSNSLFRFNDFLPDGSIPLNVAISNRRYEVVRFLLDNGSNSRMADSFRVDGCERKPIHYACISGNLELVKELIEVHNVDPEETDARNSPPLHYAAAAGNMNVLEYLVSIDCDVNKGVGLDGVTVLFNAACAGHRDIVRFLHSHGADINSRSAVGESVLFHCVRKLHLVEVLSDLIALGANVNLTDLGGNTALHQAAMSGNVLAGEKLVDAGSYVDFPKNEYINTPLQNAIVYRQFAFAVFLLNRGAESCIRCNARHSPLYTSLLRDNQDAVKLLFEAKHPDPAFDFYLFERNELRRSNAKRNVYSYALQLYSNPMSLKSLCRLYIRGRVRTTPHRGVPQLSLPSVLESFLLLEEFTTI